MTDKHAPDMHAVLSDLVGTSIATLTGRPNRVLRVSGDTVWVGTGKSPEGKPVKIEWVQAAADRLFGHGEIEISVPSVGYGAPSSEPSLLHCQIRSWRFDRGEFALLRGPKPPDSDWTGANLDDVKLQRTSVEG